MAGPSSNPVKPAVPEKHVPEIDLITDDLNELHFGETRSPNAQVTDWDMVDVTHDLEGFKLCEGSTSKPNSPQEPDWLVVNHVPLPTSDTEARQPRVTPEQPHQVYSKEIKVTRAEDSLDGSTRIVHVANPPGGQAAGNSSGGVRSRRHRKKKKEEEKKFVPYAPHHFFKKKKELVCWVCGVAGHTARKCFQRKGRRGSGQSKRAHGGLDDSSTTGGLLVG